MRKRFFLFAFLLASAGCSNEPSAPPGNALKSGGKVNVTAPGVNVDVDKAKGKVEINAPGVNIKVDPK